MNNKGQSLVLFVVILPLIFMFGVFVFDLSKAYSEKTRLDNIAYDSLYKKISSNRTDAETRNLIYQNDKKIKIEKLTDEDICLSKEVEPLFGEVIDFDKYTLRSCYVAKISNSIFRLEKKGD